MFACSRAANQFDMTPVVVLLSLTLCASGSSRAQLAATVDGDINLGAILSIRPATDPAACGGGPTDGSRGERAEAIKFAVRHVNAQVRVLQNVTLGYTIMDDCSSLTSALARAIRFMPRPFRNNGTTDDCRTTPARSPHLSPRFYDVVGVVGADTSQLSLSIANVFTLFRIPQISPMSTSDVLSNKRHFPFFTRMVPADRYQVRVIAEVLDYFNWTQVSVIFSEGSYGREGVKRLKSALGQKGICIYKKMEIEYEMSARYVDDVIAGLRGKNSPRVVVLYIEISDVKLILEAAKRMGCHREFVWIGSDSFSLGLVRNLTYMATGAISVRPYTEPVPEFEEYLARKRLSETGELQDPWTKGPTVGDPNGSFAESLLLMDVDGGRNRDGLHPNVPASFYIDAVFALAQAADRLIKERCQSLSGTGLRRCVTGDLLMAYLKNLTFNGSYGEISFDENGDVVGKYELIQYQLSNGSAVRVSVGLWDMRTNSLDIETSKLQWPQVGSERFSSTPPISSCADPCPSGYIYYFAKEACCWECRACKANEIAIINSSRCQACLEFYWPSETASNRCEPIAPYFFHFADTPALVACSIVFVGCTGCLAIAIVFFIYRDDRPIRASSREMSHVMLLGIFVTYLLVLSLMTTPTTVSCYINYVGFNVSFTLVYAPLLVKTVRIYRIFKSGRKSVHLPPCTSSFSQLMIACILVITQTVLLAIVTIISPPSVTKRMPVPTEKFVELFCQMPAEGIVLPLSYNLLLVVVCAFYAFKARKLPNNFNESRYIAFCVDTTLLVWVSFVPTYFTTSRAYYKVVVLSSALVINASVSTGCLFFTKVFALYRYRKEYQKNMQQELELFRVIKSLTSEVVDITPANQKQPLTRSRSCHELPNRVDLATVNTT